jgi:predicted polyphosphate/ATP-dependent NAD kinase
MNEMRSHHPAPVSVVEGSAIGIIPNPMSGRDIRRIISQASVFPNTEKSSMVLRILRTVGTLGVERVLLSTDTFGIAAGVQREIKRMSGARSTTHIRWPKVEFLTLEGPTGTAADTTAYAQMMAGQCSAAVVLLGGDGTMRAAVPGLGDTPMLALSTGTNNAFPVMIEATVAGMALGMIATRAAPAPTTHAKLLHVEVTRSNGSVRHEVALVDVCVNTLSVLGSRALWKADSLRELYCTFAEPHAIGLTSIAGRLRPTGRYEPRGVAVRLDDPSVATHSVLAPIAPGLLESVGVLGSTELLLNVSHRVELDRGTIALDGERELEFGPDDAITVTLAQDGPRVIDVPTVLAASARVWPNT